MSTGPVTLRRWQAEAMPLALAALEGREPGLVVATTGCHAAGQGILRYDGSIVNVEDVRVGDLLMGPDSTPRRVIRLCRGRAPMYEIRPTKGEPWVVNGDHVLTVQDTRTEASGALLDVTVHEWLTGGLRNPLFPEIANPKRQPDRVGTRAYWKLVRTGVEFPAHTGPAAVEPYLLGVLLGDGCLCSASVSVTSADAEIVAEMRACAQRLGLSLTVANKLGTPAQTLTFSGRRGIQNPLRVMISELGLSGTRSRDKFIPRRYLTGSRHERLEVLAGLLDTDGALSNGGYDYVSQSQRMAGEVAFIARSLGLAAYCTPCEKRDQNGNGGTYYRVSISGDCSVVPVRIPRKRAEPRQQIKSVLRTGFEVVPLNYEDDFYGFTLDGDHRYLLADFTVTHNSGKSIFLAELLRQWRERHGPDEGAVVVTTPSRPLVEQLSKTIGDVLGSHVVGRYYTKAKQHKREVIVCCNPSVPLLALKLEEEGRKVAVWVADECHKTTTMEIEAGADDEGDALADDVVSERLNAERRLGVTATPFRSDERERLRLFTRVVYRYPPADALRDGVIVPWRFIPWEGDDTPIDRACAEMILALGDRATRGPGVVNATSIDDAEAYCGFLANYGLEARPIHSKMSAAEQKANVEALRVGAIDCLVHVSMLVEGVDYPWLRWGCFRREVGARVRFIQELGRYLRAYGDKREALILDPHNLADAFQVTYEEALGWVDDEDEEGEGEQERKEREEQELRGDDEEPRVVMAKRVGALSRYVRQLHLALIAEGICQAPAGVKAGGWRNDGASPRQVQALQRMVRMAARLGKEHRAALGKIADRPDAVTKGLASDALDLLNGVRNLPGGEVWRPAVPIDVPPDIAFEPVVDPIVYVAGAMKGGWAAVAVVQGGRTLYTQARPSRQGDRWQRLTTAAMLLACDRFGAREIGSTDPDVVATVPSGVVGRLVTKRELNPAERVVWRTIREAEVGGVGAA